MDKLKQKLRENLTGQLSDEKTEVDVNIACKIAEEFAVSFVEWKDGNCFELFDTKTFYYRDSEIYQDAYTNKELLEIFKKEMI